MVNDFYIYIYFRHIVDLKLDISTSRANETALSVLKELSAVKIAYEVCHLKIF